MRDHMKLNQHKSLYICYILLIIYYLSINKCINYIYIQMNNVLYNLLFIIFNNIIRLF